MRQPDTRKTVILMKQTSRRSPMQSQIDENLKLVYQQALEQDVPDRFKDLLAQLREKELGTEAISAQTAGKEQTK